MFISIDLCSTQLWPVKYFCTREESMKICKLQNYWLWAVSKTERVLFMKIFPLVGFTCFNGQFHISAYVGSINWLTKKQKMENDHIGRSTFSTNPDAGSSQRMCHQTYSIQALTSPRSLTHIQQKSVWSGLSGRRCALHQRHLSLQGMRMLVCGVSTFFEERERGNRMRNYQRGEWEGDNDFKCK